MTIATLIGNEIGNSNINRAKLIFKYSLLFCLLVNIFQASILWFCQEQIFSIFTMDDKVQLLRSEVYQAYFLLLILDFWQTIFLGVFRGLGKQAICNVINIFSYYALAIPLAIFFTFYFVGMNFPFPGLGNIGIWYGFCIAMAFEIVVVNVYLIIFMDLNEIAQQC